MEFTLKHPISNKDLIDSQDKLINKRSTQKVEIGECISYNDGIWYFIYSNNPIESLQLRSSINYAHYIDIYLLQYLFKMEYPFNDVKKLLEISQTQDWDINDVIDCINQIKKKSIDFIIHTY